MLILSDFKDSPNTARSLISRGETLVTESVRAGVEVESEDNVKTRSRLLCLLGPSPGFWHNPLRVERSVRSAQQWVASVHMLRENVLCCSHWQVSLAYHKKRGFYLAEKNLDIFSCWIFFSNLMQPSPLCDLSPYVSRRWLISFSCKANCEIVKFTNSFIDLFCPTFVTSQQMFLCIT